MIIIRDYIVDNLDLDNPDDFFEDIPDLDNSEGQFIVHPGDVQSSNPSNGPPLADAVNNDSFNLRVETSNFPDMEPPFRCGMSVKP